MSSTTGTMMGSGGGRGNDNDNGHEDEENHHEFTHGIFDPFQLEIYR